MRKFKAGDKVVVVRPGLIWQKFINQTGIVKCSIIEVYMVELNGESHSNPFLEQRTGTRSNCKFAFIQSINLGHK